MVSNGSKTPHIWLTATSEATPLSSLGKLPIYGALFFLQNMGGFLFPFLLLSLASITGAALGFGMIYLISELINEALTIAPDRLLSYYLPLFVLIIVVKETIEYFIRKYGEAFATIYSDHLQQRFLLSLLRLRFSALNNVQPQRLLALISRYIANVRFFIDDWFWGSSRKITHFVITLCILYVQSPVVLGANIVYFTLFLALALRISAKLSPLAEKFTQEDLNAGTTIGSFSYNLASVRRLGITSFFSQTYRNAILLKWERFADVREFHARRWLLQLVLFDVGYIATLGVGVYQVANKTLPLGYLVLIKYAFDTLSQILIHIIEYYVSLVQQREDGIIIRKELASLEGKSSEKDSELPKQWGRLELTNGQCTFLPSAQSGHSVSIRVPHISIQRGQKIGIMGPSGIGKTTILNMLLNLTEFDGTYQVDGKSIKGESLSATQICLINNSDPLFALSLRDNLLLGRNISDERILSTLELVAASDFAQNLDAKVGESNFNLSSGQQQRVRLARGLLGDADIYLLDEPFNGIDDTTKAGIIVRLKTLLQEKTIILVTHNDTELTLVDEVHHMKDGTLI